VTGASNGFRAFHVFYYSTTHSTSLGTQLDRERRTPTLSEMAEEEQDPTEIVREECKQTKCAKAWADYHEVRSPHSPRPARARDA
jgi:hypothetical protein